MQLAISRKELLRGLARTYSVADRKSLMPVLSNVLLSADGTKSLRFAATDLYLAVTSTATAEIQSGGTVAVSARTLFDIVKNLPEGDVRLSTTDTYALDIRVGKVRFKLPGSPGQDFPVLPSPGEAKFAEVSIDVLGKLISLTHYCMSADETRPHLAGAMFEGDGKILRMVTTDGHRLSKAEHKENEGREMLNFKMLVPAKGISELRRLAEETKTDRPKPEDRAQTVGIATTGGNAFFRREDVLLSVKLAEEDFPPYSKVIPETHTRRVVVARSLLAEALRRISLIAKEKSGVVRVGVDAGTLSIASESAELGEGAEEIDVDFAGEPVEIGFNARYLLDVLGAVSEEEVVIELGGELDPGVVRPVGATEFIGVVMPMRI